MLKNVVCLLKRYIQQLFLEPECFLIAHEAEGRMGYRLRGHEGKRNNGFSKIQLVGQKYRRVVGAVVPCQNVLPQ